jgi:hypothetical protein
MTVTEKVNDLSNVFCQFMFFRVEVLLCPVDVQTNQDLPVLVAVVAEHNVPLAASCQKLIRVVQPVLVD